MILGVVRRATLTGKQCSWLVFFMPKRRCYLKLLSAEVVARQSGFCFPDDYFIGHAMATTKDFVKIVPTASAMFDTVFPVVDDVTIDRATETGARTVTPLNVMRSFAF